MSSRLVPYFTKTTFHFYGLISGFVLQFLDEFLIGGQPIDASQFILRQPAGCFVFEELWATLNDVAEEAIENEVKIGVVPFHNLGEAVYLDVDFQFFPDFADDGLFGGLSRFQFAARELPIVLSLAVSALGGENATQRVEDDGGGNNFLLHIVND